MTQKEQMLRGNLYNPQDEQLAKEHLQAQTLLFQLNQLPPCQKQERVALIKQLFGKSGQNVWVEPYFMCDYGYNIQVGENFFANYHCVILDCAKVVIGDDVLFGPQVGVYTATHPLDAIQRSQGLESAKEVHIGNRVWIGAGARILPGVHIGDNTTIGAGSVVTGDIPANVVAAGNPCKVIRTLENESSPSAAGKQG